MRKINSLLISEFKPDVTNVIWIKPQNGKYRQYIYNNGDWVESDDNDAEVEKILKELVTKSDKVAINVVSDDVVKADMYNILNVSADTTITLEQIEDEYMHHYFGELVFGDTVYAVTFPTTIIFDDVPEYQANTRYQFSVVNDLGVIREFLSE